MLALSLFAATAAAHSSDAVTSLPTYGKVHGKQYAGFAPATADGKNMLHYWFVECDKGNGPEVPVLLWLNGGPGVLLARIRIDIPPYCRPLVASLLNG